MNNKKTDLYIYLSITIVCCILISFPYLKSCVTSNQFIDQNEKQLTQTNKSQKTILKNEIGYPKNRGNKNSIILERINYTLSFNPEWNIPNWVAWELNREKLVEVVSRRGVKFISDPDLPVANAVQWNEYKGSGLTRGHMCPAADSRWSEKAMSESFYMSNICPQNEELNNGDWQELERACRRWTKSEGQLFIVCGPIFYKDNEKYIGTNHRIRVPDAYFKVVLCLTSKKPKGIGFIFKNIGGNQKISSYVNSIDEVERITNIDFFSGLDDKEENRVEAECNLELWP